MRQWGKRIRRGDFKIILFMSILLFSFLSASTSEAQLFSFGQRSGRGILWTWVGGTQTLSSTGVYGTKGVPSTSNYPAARGYGCSATDPSGNFWLFGGDDYGGTKNLFHDLWRYNPTTREWTWMSGASTPNNGGTGAVYGTKGTPSTSNSPGARKEAVCWSDDSGNFWLFGGLETSSTNKNDLWRFNPSTSEWTWMSGSNTTNATAVFGTKGVENATNMPSGRERMASWKDSSGNLWFFGGYDNSVGGRMSDMWRYRPSTNQWTWMAGPSAMNQAGVYGTRGVPSTSNTPGGRRAAAFMAATDSAGNFWLFGGDQPSTTMMTDLWRFNPSTAEWTWIAGPTTSGATGNYGTMLISHPNNAVPQRRLHLTAVGKNDEIYVLGGYNGTINLNDFWVYSTTTDLWTWISGSNAGNAATTFGALNEPSFHNMPGGRDGVQYWKDAAGDIWIFGGITTKAHADFWKAVRY